MTEVMSIMRMVQPERDIPEDDIGAYYKLDENLEPVECSMAEWEDFQKTAAALVATTHIGSQASVVTTFEGEDDGFDPDDPHLFMTVVTVPQTERSETEGHRTWHEAEAAHRERVDELKAFFERRRRENEPQLDLL